MSELIMDVLPSNIINLLDYCPYAKTQIQCVKI